MSRSSANRSRGRVSKCATPCRASRPLPRCPCGGVSGIRLFLPRSTPLDSTVLVSLTTLTNPD